MPPPARKAAKKTPARRGGPAAVARKQPKARKAGAATKPGAAKTGGAKKKSKVMRAGSKQPDSAELRKHKTKAGASGGQYKEKNGYLEDLMLCVRIYTKKYRLGERRPGFKKLQETYGVPATSIQNAVQRKDFYRDRDEETGSTRRTTTASSSGARARSRSSGMTRTSTTSSPARRRRCRPRS